MPVDVDLLSKTHERIVNDAGIAQSNRATPRDYIAQDVTVKAEIITPGHHIIENLRVFDVNRRATAKFSRHGDSPE
jgi:hypothetical protein